MQTNESYPISKLIGLFLGPLFFIVFAVSPHSENINPEVWNFIAIIGFMIIWWIFEPVHNAVTALLPVILFPIMGVLDSYSSFTSYGNPYIFLFLGGFFIAIAIEKHDLHIRIAYKFIKLFGKESSMVILSIMLSTYFFSMWISNTATTMMILPIAISIIKFLEQEDIAEKEKKNFIISLLISIPYSATIGGMVTIIGSPPNVVITSFFRDNFLLDIEFWKWFGVSFPISIILFISSWFILTKILFPSNIKMTFLKNFIIQEMNESSINRRQLNVAIIFMIAIILWMTRSLISYYINFDLKDETIALLCGILLFIIPSNLSRGRFLLEWQETKNLPWGVILLFGSGIAIANAVINLKLHELIYYNLSATNIPEIYFILGIIIFITIVTEFINNTSLSIIMIPLVTSLSIAMGFNPLTMSIITVMLISSAFALPIATPPNSFIFINKYISSNHLTRSGVILKLISCIAIYIFYYFGLFDIYEIDISFIKDSGDTEI